MNAAATEPEARRPEAREARKILGDCRDLALHRLVLSFSSMLDRVGDMLMERANRSVIREDTATFLAARTALKTERSNLMTEFERRLRQHVDARISGDAGAKADFSKVDATKLTLIDTSAMDESVLTGNITRIVENFCHEELQTLNRGLGHLLGRPDLEMDANPLAPSAIVDAFAGALRGVKAEERIKLTILKELNQSSLGDLNAIYADLNQHLINLRVMPAAPHSKFGGRGAAAARARARKSADKRGAAAADAEVDVMALFKKMMGGPEAAAASLAAGSPPAFPPFAARGGLMAPIPQVDPAAARYLPTGPMAPTPSGYLPGAPIMATRQLGEGLARLQAGETGFDLGDGTFVRFAGIPQGTHNVLRDLQESPLGQRVNQLESMTIELVAMLFDFIFETRDLPDGIKAALARLQIPVLKAAMLDGAFFAKKSHPARILVNALAQAGLGWSAAMGHEDPLYRKIDEIVHRILDGFSDNLAIFEELRTDLEQFLAEEEKAAEANILSMAEEIDQRDRREVAPVVAKLQIERRIETYPVPNFLAAFLRQRWSGTLEHVYLAAGDESEVWDQAVATVEDLVWSVQPKRTPEDRRHLVALLPSLLKRLTTGLHDVPWPREDRERFMENLVEAHAAAVKPSAAAAALPTAAVAEQAKADAAQAKAAGDAAAAVKAEELAVAMSQAEPAPVEEPAAAAIDDQFLEIAQSLERGMWIEFEGDDSQLAFAKLAWVSPLRGTYLFTNRQGQKALSMTAEELAGRFRNDQARLVEAEPLMDQAFTSMMASFTEKTADQAA